MRTCQKRPLAVAALLVAAFALFAEHPPYERYQSIVDRQMFGEPPPGFDPTRPPSEVQKSVDAKSAVELTKEQEQLKSAVHFSVINIAEDGTPMVGFSDNSDAKLPKHYFLRLGEARDGWLVKEADPETKTMTIVKNDIEVELALGDNSGSGGGKTARAGAGAPAGASAAAARARGPLFGGASAASSMTLRGRRQALQQQREAELQAMKDERKKLEEERRMADEKKLLDEEARAAEREEVRKELRAIMEAQEKIRAEKEQAKKVTEAAEAAAEGE